MRTPLVDIPATHRAFTLIEVIVVIILLGVAAAVVIPRAFSGSAKRAEQTARSVAGMLTAIAQRDATAFEPMLLVYSREDATLEVRVMRGDAEGRDRAWKPDLFIEPVGFGEGVLRSASVDGQPLDEREWRIELPVNTPRPGIVLEIAPKGADDGSGRAWRITLPAGASTARLADLPSETGGQNPSAQVVDLDAIGMGDRAW